MIVLIAIPLSLARGSLLICFLVIFITAGTGGLVRAVCSWIWDLRNLSSFSVKPTTTHAYHKSCTGKNSMVPAITLDLATPPFSAVIKLLNHYDAFSPGPHASSFRTIQSLASALNMHVVQVDIYQAIFKGELLPGHGCIGKFHIPAPPGYNENPACAYRLGRLLYGMP